VIDTNLPVLSHGRLLIKFSLSTWDCLTLMSPLGVSPCEYPDKLYLSRNDRDCSTRRWKLHDRIFICLDTIPERDRQAHRQTDKIRLASTVLCIASNADVL